tara:strand:- start:370 stop:561 length:192 start_codon:yes stop_codon:yes gene_type:complete
MISCGMKQVYGNWIKDIDESLAHLKMSQTDTISDFQTKLTANAQKLENERAGLVALLLTNQGE